MTLFNIINIMKHCLYDTQKKAKEEEKKKEQKEIESTDTSQVWSM